MRPAFDRLTAAWTARRMAQFDEAMTALAQPLARAACDAVPLPADRLMARLGKSLGLARPEGETAEARAAADMATRLDADLRAGMDRLIEIHGLEGRAAGELMARLATDVRTETPMDEGKAAALGGVVTGALTGLGADLATGGLTFGAGMLAGALLGALGGAGVARGVNVMRGRTEAIVRWDERFLDGLVTVGAAALPCGRALWPRPRRMAGKRIPAVLARAGGGGRRLASAGAGCDLGVAGDRWRHAAKSNRGCARRCARSRLRRSINSTPGRCTCAWMQRRLLRRRLEEIFRVRLPRGFGRPNPDG